MTLDLFREVSAKYYDLLEEDDSEFSFDLLPYEFNTDAQDLVWSEYEKEFTQTILNVFNSFAYCLYKLHCLEKIISTYEDEQDAFSLRNEFIHIPLHFCLNKPYEFSGRVQYCSIILCRQADEVALRAEEIFEEIELYNFSTLKKSSKNWSTRIGLLQALDAVGNWNDDFKDITKNYRDRSQHRIPPNLDIGLSSRVEKKIISTEDLPELVRELNGIEAGKRLVSYQFGGESPLETRALIPALVKQGEEMRKLFYKYWDLVKEQSSAINSKIHTNN